MKLAHDVAGSGPTVVLLHSTVCDRRMWDAQVPALVDAGYRVVRSDLRGFGESPVPDRPHNDADDVIQLLDQLGVDDAALVGASGGGRVALEIAARWPHRIRSLALLCTALGGHEASAELRTFGEREDILIEAGDIAGAADFNAHTWLGPHADETTRDKVRQMQKHAFEVQLAAVEDFEPIRVTFDLTAITAPALLISGEHDFTDFSQIAAWLSGQLADAHHLELAWAGHLPSLERPEALNPLLIGFLQETLNPGSLERRG